MTILTVTKYKPKLFYLPERFRKPDASRRLRGFSSFCDEPMMPDGDRFAMKVGEGSMRTVRPSV